MHLTSKISLCSGLALLVAGCASQGTEAASAPVAAEPEVVSLLFVQVADRVECDGSEIVLLGVHPSTVFFSDRPERMAGYVATDKFVAAWNDGPDSFFADPPNATLSALVDGEVELTVVTLSNPRLAEGRLAYDVRFVEGAPSASGTSCTLFIDSYHRLVDDRTHDQVKHVTNDRVYHGHGDDRTHDQVKNVTDDRTDDRVDDRVNDRVDDRVDDRVN